VPPDAAQALAGKGPIMSHSRRDGRTWAACGMAALTLTVLCAVAQADIVAVQGSLFKPSDATVNNGTVNFASGTLAFDTDALSYTWTAGPGGTGEKGASVGGNVELAVFTFDEVTFGSGLTAIQVNGSRGLVLASTGNFTFSGATVNVNGQDGSLVALGQTLPGGAGGPGAEGGVSNTSYDSTAAVSRGTGGDGSSDGTGTAGVGYGGGAYGSGTDFPGNGGGYGGTGGDGRYGGAAPYLGPSYGDNLLTDLYGGSGGSGGRVPVTYPTGSGGGGGGALEFIAMGTLSIEDAAIAANGGAGGGSNTSRRGGGGGSGGGIILAATEIDLVGTNAVTADGGRGGSASNGTQWGGSGGGGRIALYYDTLTGNTAGITANSGGGTTGNQDVLALDGTVNLAAGPMIPEPATMALLGLGGLALAGIGRRRRA
jgi:hypothetical protein